MTFLPHWAEVNTASDITNNTMLDKPFVNQFWGDPEKGFNVLQTRIRQSLTTLDEIILFYKQRVAIEKEYTKRLDKLNSQVVLGSSETGTLKVALEKLQHENIHMIAHSTKMMSNINTHNVEKLQLFYHVYLKNTNKLEVHMARVLKKLRESRLHMEATKEKYRSECATIKSLTLLLQTTWGREHEKSTAKMERSKSNLPGLRQNYQLAIERYRQIHEIWVRDWTIALLNVYQLEIERIQTCKLNCFGYCNHVASLCVDWDHAVDEARLKFAKVGAPLDVHEFARNYGTGPRISKPPEFVDFMEGENDDSEREDAYTTAEFKDPDYSSILHRTYSVQSGIVAASRFTPENSDTTPRSEGNSPSRQTTQQKELPPIKKNAPALAPDSQQSGLRKSPSRNSAATSSDDQIFERSNPLHNSNGLLEYSSATTHSTHTTHTTRSWASPRKLDRLNLQKEINRRLRDMSEMFGSRHESAKPAANVPIAKDFSIDFIAKALEDLNAGGNGDVNRFRRSVRETRNGSSSTLLQGVPASDFVDDSAETATRLDSIKFRSPKAKERPISMMSPAVTPSSRNGRPKSVGGDIYRYESGNLTGTIVHRDVDSHDKGRARRSLLRSPTKSFVNLHQIVGNVTPVTHNNYESLAVAQYDYASREAAELLFKKGWHMYVIHKQEDNWYVCELGENAGSARGSVGLVPYNYVREVSAK